MSVDIIVGTQWGDEGKGKITDILAEKVDLVVRYQGGNNAGHTVVVGEKTFKLHLKGGLPIFIIDVRCILSNLIDNFNQNPSILFFLETRIDLKYMYFHLFRIFLCSSLKSSGNFLTM